MNEEQRKFYFYKMTKNNLCPIHKCRLKDGSCGFCVGRDPPRLTQGVTQRERKVGRQDNERLKNFVFDNYPNRRTRDWKDNFRYKNRDEQLHILEELRHQNGETYRGVPRLRDPFSVGRNWPKSDKQIENDPEFLKWRFQNNTGSTRNRSTHELIEMYKEIQNGPE